jgi:hypothetical protein
MNAYIFGWLSLFIVVSHPLFAQGAWNQTRIAGLIGPIDTPLAVEPAIPADFVAMSPKGKIDAQDWIYWGPKHVLERYFADQNSLESAVLRVKLSEIVKQTSPDGFNKENDALADALAPIGLKRMYDLRMKWGKYPIYAITAQFEKKWLYAAWVGLADSQGTTLCFELVYPHGKPNTLDFQLWNTFLDNTKPLPDSLYSQGFHLDVRPGCTRLRLYGENVTVFGEQRISDKMVQLVVDLAGSGFSFTTKNVSYEFMLPGEKTPGGPAAKIHGQFRKTDGSLAVMQAVPVIIKKVPVFTINAQEAKASGKIVYEEKLPSMIQEYIGVN